jgi:predicted transcriptional regulator of viral defense system
MDLAKAMTLSLGERTEPVFTRYQLGLVLHGLYAKKSYRGEAITDLEQEVGEFSEFKRCLKELEARGILSPFPELNLSCYALHTRRVLAAEEVACSVDPFCYISHLSALAHHGLTNRIPAKLFISSPKAADWKKHAEAQMLKDLGNGLEAYRKNGMPLLTRIKMEKLGKTQIHRFDATHLGAYKNVRDKTLRVSTMGRTFLDMLRSPELCGGIHHVLEVYEESAKTYQRLIVDEIDRHGAPIDKVRAGYILSEKLRIQDEVVESWVKFAQRGGSRKLDAAGEYIAEWSDKWCLSLNV